MIEIKSRWDNSVLYTAKDASDVREAVKAARRDGANLYGADLTRADLTRADLSGANLSGANLYGANLYGANLSGANLYGANLSGANLYGADLTRANLTRANLTRADLTGANLTRADLTGANLTRADLTRANLTGADDFQPERTDDLRILLDQGGKVRAYKLVTSDLKSPIHTGTKLTYEIGSTVKANASSDEADQCGAGVNLATLPWCLRCWQPGYRVLLCEFVAKDIAAIPYGTDGKFRVRKAKVIREVDISELVGEANHD